MAVTIRAARPGDGSGMVRAWGSAADYYGPVSVSFYENRAGYQRRAIFFQKNLG
jgi:hypothetical protein